MRSVIVLVADTKYTPHAKSVMVNCVRQGKWKGDFALILPPDCDKADFEARGIHVLTDPEPTYYKKFALFDPSFEKWDSILYMDCDVLVQNPLEPLFHELRWGEILADLEPFSLEHSFTYWAKPEELAQPERVDVFNWLWGNPQSKYDRNRRNFNSGVMLWNPLTLPPNPRQQLLDMRKKVAPINCHCTGGTDQPIMGLVFYDYFAKIRSDLVCYWKSAWEQTIIVHTCSGYAPWLAKKPGMECYRNEKLGRPYHEVYLENLALFNETFPVKA